MENSTTFSRDWRVKIGALTMALALAVAAMAVQPARAYPRWRAHRQYRYGRRPHRGVIYAPAPNPYYAPPPPVVYAPPPPPGGFTFIFPFRIR